MRIAFMGTPAFAAACLTAVAQAGHDIVRVYSQPPKPRGRGRAMTPSPVHALADSLGLEARTPLSMRDPEEIAALRALELDALVVVAFGQILPSAVLEAPRLGSYNLHASLLPRWRGAAPIQRAIMAGDTETGAQVMRMTEGLDEGPVIATARVAIAADDTAQTLHDALAIAGANVLVEALAQVERGEAVETPQATEGVTYARKISPAEARIDWSLPAQDIDRQIRGLSPFPGAWFEVPSDRGPTRIKALLSEVVVGDGAPGEILDDALAVACGSGAVRLVRAQREGKGAQDATDFLRGFPAASRRESRLMPRFRLTLEYDGRAYNGFQAQDGLPTIQGVVERAIHAFCGEQIRLQAAGRTDAGVHATGQVVHIDLEKPWRAAVVRDALNAHLLGEAVVVVEAEETDPSFHARFGAAGRRYLYRILNRRSPPALEKGRVWHVKKPLDAEAMHAAAQVLVGHHDFTTFRDLACQAKSPVKTLDLIRVWRVDEEVRLEFASRSFLHRQVRSMTGSIAEVGVGRWSRDDLLAALEARDRRACGPVAPSDGLYLTGVVYENAAK